MQGIFAEAGMSSPGAQAWLGRDVCSGNGELSGPFTKRMRASMPANMIGTALALLQH